MSWKPSQLTGHVARRNALVDGGWLAMLSHRELKLWEVYSRYADVNGIAFPGNELIAERMGHANERHISDTRRALTGRGLLVILDAGGGRGNPCKIQLKTPANPAGDCGGLFDLETPAESSTKPPPNRALNPRRIEHALNKEEQTSNRPEQTILRADEPRGEVKTSPSVNARVETKPGRRTASRKLSDEQQAVREAFSDWWTKEAWPARNGGAEYEFAGGRDGKAVMLILESKFVAWDLERGKLVARTFLADSDAFITKRGHVLYDLAERFPRYVSIAARRGDRNGKSEQHDDYATPVRRFGSPA